MSDLIKLTCPTCGGKLEVSPDASSYICEHCGNEHVFEQDSQLKLLESFAKCPQCSRNDQTRRVQAIVKSQTQHLDGTTVTDTLYRDKNGDWRSTRSRVPFTGKQTSELARQLSPPTAPTKPGSRALWLAIAILGIPVGLCFTTIGVAGAVGFLLGMEDQGGGCLVLPALIVGVAQLISIPYLLRQRKKTLAEAAAKYAEEKLAWQAAMEKYRRLYYCFRDDIVFNSETGTTCAPSRLMEYLYSGE